MFWSQRNKACRLRYKRLISSFNHQCPSYCFDLVTQLKFSTKRKVMYIFPCNWKQCSSLIWKYILYEWISTYLSCPGVVFSLKRFLLNWTVMSSALRQRPLVEQATCDLLQEGLRQRHVPTEGARLSVITATGTAIQNKGIILHTHFTPRNHACRDLMGFSVIS